MIRNSIGTLVAVLSLVGPRPSEGLSCQRQRRIFASTSPLPHRAQHHFPHLLATTRPEEEGMEKLDAARREFEHLITMQQQKDGSITRAAKPLTASSQRLKEMELKLLAELEDTDEVVDPLVELWQGERADAAQALKEMETGTCSPGLYEEEERLRGMIQRYGIEWVEPMSRLALLLFTKGRNSEAIPLIRTVLEIKPWHFEAGTLLVVMLLREGDYAAALRAARAYTLPNFNERTDNKRRKTWVKEKVRQAQELFDFARDATLDAVHGDVVDECPLEEDYCWQ